MKALSEKNRLALQTVEAAGKHGCWIHSSLANPLMEKGYIQRLPVVGARHEYAITRQGQEYLRGGLEYPTLTIRDYGLINTPYRRMCMRTASPLAIAHQLVLQAHMRYHTEHKQPRTVLHA